MIYAATFFPRRNNHAICLAKRNLVTPSYYQWLMSLNIVFFKFVFSQLICDGYVS